MYQCYSIIIDRGISAPKHGKKVLDGLNDVDKLYIYQLMSTFQLPESNRFDSQMQIHTVNQNYDTSLAQLFQHYLKNSTAEKLSLIRTNTKIFMERKWTDRKYHIQDNDDFTHQDVKCIVTQNNSQHYRLVVHIPNLMAQEG